MLTIRCLVLCLYILSIRGDDIDRAARKGAVFKLLREMVNQTQADTLNLPANATSIRENITDTFSCENRTYGYYADVDNECQVFHVCLTSQSSGGRNVTYRWSFICPKETIFNQEVLTCTRPRDSINCEDSPMYYHLNMDIGKVPNDTDTKQEETKKEDKRRKPVRRQNLVMENIIKEVNTEIKKEDLQMFDFENIEEAEAELIPVIEESEVIDEEIEEIKDTNKNINDGMFIKNTKNRNEENMVRNGEPVVHEVNGKYKMQGKRMENARLGSERSLKESKDKKRSRGLFRFKADV